MGTGYKHILFSGHALGRIFQRGIGKDEILRVIREGETIAVYQDDTPYPSKLVLGFIGDTPLHVVIAADQETLTAIVVTAYVPEEKFWTDNFRTRR